jgi:hypothetical protein
MCEECCEREVIGNSVQIFVGEQLERPIFRLKDIFKILNKRVMAWSGLR